MTLWRRGTLSEQAREYSLGRLHPAGRHVVFRPLENIGIPENVSAEIPGHDKPRTTYGLYSGETSLEVKAKALEKIGHPGMG